VTEPQGKSQGELAFGKESVVGPCGLELACDWGGVEETCCLDCAELPDCLKICGRAESQLMTGEKCRWREDRARNQRDSTLSEAWRKIR